VGKTEKGSLKLEAFVNTLLRLTILSLAVLCSCRSTEKYTYLQQGNTQVRVDERSGRTDRLTDNGWIPISFERAVCPRT
jgi:hypothetical protein